MSTTSPLLQSHCSDTSFLVVCPSPSRLSCTAISQSKELSGAQWLDLTLAQKLEPWFFLITDHRHLDQGLFSSNRSKADPSAPASSARVSARAQQHLSTFHHQCTLRTGAVLVDAYSNGGPTQCDKVCSVPCPTEDVVRCMCLR